MARACDPAVFNQEGERKEHAERKFEVNANKDCCLARVGSDSAITEKVKGFKVVKFAVGISKLRSRSNAQSLAQVNIKQIHFE